MNKESGEPFWQFDAQAVVLSSPAIAGEQVFIGSMDGYLHAVNINNGEQTWRFDSGWAIFASPFVDNGTLYISSDDGDVFALR